MARQDNLEFLSDIIPKTIPYSEVKKRKAPAGANPSNGEAIEAGQTTLDGGRAAVLNGTGTNGFGHDVANDDADPADPNVQLSHEMEIRGVRTSSIGSTGMNGQNKKDVDMEE